MRAGLYLDDFYFSHNFQVVRDDFPIQVDGILGLDFISDKRAIIDYENWNLRFRPHHSNDFLLTAELRTHTKIYQVILPPRAQTFRIANFSTTEDYVFIPDQEVSPNVFIERAIVPVKNAMIRVFNFNHNYVEIDKPSILYESLSGYDVYKLDGACEIDEQHVNKVLNALQKNFPTFVKEELGSLCREFADVFATSEDPVKVNNFYSQKLHLSNGPPVYVKNYRTPYTDMSEIERQVKNLQKNDYIEPSVSEYNNPILLVSKKSHELLP